MMGRNHKEYRAMERKGRPTSQTVTRDWSVGLNDVGSEVTDYHRLDLRCH